MKNNFVEGNYEDKYNTNNPISKFLVSKFLESFKKFLEIIKKESYPTKIVEIGCGEGELLKIINHYFPKSKLYACDLSPREIKKAKKNCQKLNIDFSVQNAEKLLKYQDKEFDLVICCEALEHLKNPSKGLSEIKRITRENVIVSVPIEPLWRILNISRGKYLKNLGNTPGHLNHWSIFSFQKLLKINGFKIKKGKMVFPWQIYLIKRKNDKAQEGEGILSPFLKNQRYKITSKEIESKRKVLDIGCGKGDLKNRLIDCDYFGIDLKKRWPTDSKNLFICDISKTIPKQLTNEKFDCIVALAIIEHLKEPKKFLANIKTLLAPSGKIILTTPHPLGRKIHDFGAKIGIFSKEAAEEHEKFLARDDFIKLSKENNLRVTKYKRFLLGLNQLVVLKKQEVNG